MNYQPLSTFNYEWDILSRSSPGLRVRSRRREADQLVGIGGNFEQIGDKVTLAAAANIARRRRRGGGLRHFSLLGLVFLCLASLYLALLYFCEEAIASARNGLDETRGSGPVAQSFAYLIERCA